jgi:hypothetical protein
MPTYGSEPPFQHDYQRLTHAQRQAFSKAVRKFVHDLQQGVFRKGLRIKRVQGHPGVWEMTWADDGRATFRYGDAVHPGDVHVIWRRVGSHDIFDSP